MEKQVSAVLPSSWGVLNISAYANQEDDRMPHLAYVHPEMDASLPVVVRVHSECLTGDLLGSHRCDCGAQLQRSMDIIAEQKGMLIYLRQEGRGIGLINKLKAYNLQDKGLDTIKANHQLGFATDERTYEIARFILNDFGVDQVRLLTNNPLKVSDLKKDGIQVVERLPIQIAPIDENREYLDTKRDEMGHYL